MPNPFDLTGRSALITGSSRGISHVESWRSAEAAFATAADATVSSKVLLKFGRAR